MWFDPSMEHIYTDGIYPAIEEAGYLPVRIDKKEHNNKIDDEIIAEIKKAKFVVADFTSEIVDTTQEQVLVPRGGVYFEAGFAMGLGIPVIWCCKKSLIKFVHFDTRQFSHVIWETADDLKERLYNRVCAVIGERST